MERPDLPPAFVVDLGGRGEVFFRHHRHDDPTRPTLLLLHGWTASADLQWVTAYEALERHWSFVAPDHRGHGRGIRSSAPFTLEDVADDAAALVRHLGLRSVVPVGYSMGGPVALHLTLRHPDLVPALVVGGTALEWRDTRLERAGWRLLWLVERAARSRRLDRVLRTFISRSVMSNPELEVWGDYLLAELSRGDARAIRQAGEALGAYDARPFASRLGVPTAVVITTRDRLVRPRKQWALAEAMAAETFEVPADHDALWAAGPATVAAYVAAIRAVLPPDVAMPASA